VLHVGLNSTRVLAANTPPHALAWPKGPEAWMMQAQQWTR